mgnify:CR=1 FL=1
MAAAGFADEADRIASVRSHVRDQLAGNISPERIINAMLKKTEIEIVDALIKSYNKRLSALSEE